MTLGDDVQRVKASVLRARLTNRSGPRKWDHWFAWKTMKSRLYQDRIAGPSAD